MRKVVIVWPDNTDYLINEVALAQGARWHQKFIKDPIDVLSMGPWNIIEPIRDELQNLNYRLHDASYILESLKTRYSHLYRKYPTFHFNGLMRWVVMDIFFQEEKYVSFDADLVICSDVLENKLLENSRFTPTSTCFNVINSREWLRQYITGINLMNDDPETFRADWERVKDDEMLGPADQFEVNEETFVRWLAKERTTNHFPTHLKYWCTPMHLAYFDGNFPLQQIATPIKYERTQQGEMLNGQPLAFIHFQYQFKEYLSSYVMLKYIMQVNSLEQLEPWFFHSSGRSRNPQFLEMQQKARDFFVHKHYRPDVSHVFTRKFVMEEFLFRGDFGRVFNDRIWHTPGVFAAIESAGG